MCVCVCVCVCAHVCVCENSNSRHSTAKCEKSCSDRKCVYVCVYCVCVCAPGSAEVQLLIKMVRSVQRQPRDRLSFICSANRAPLPLSGEAGACRSLAT